ncbi:MAG: Electron transport complex protein RnfA [Acidobacteria bacterium ADurb.Bin340]|nr:MAG: Electron transport complex protein RnfA [Acidobacteria bacterium ADurb.Bin340]
MSPVDLILLSVNTMLVTNIVFARFLGICPYLGVSKKVETASGMGMAVIFVMTLAAAFSWAIQKLLLKPLGLEYLQTIIFILVIAALVQFVEFFMKKSMPTLYRALGIYLPLITTNCTILWVALYVVQEQFSFLTMLIFSLATGAGYLLAIVLFASLRERLETADIPEAFKGLPIALVTAALLGMAFMGFSGLVKV